MFLNVIFFSALKDSSAAVPDRTALILFEDIDLFFGEADEGFYSAVNSLIATTKRPILLTTSKSSFLGKKHALKKYDQFALRGLSQIMWPIFSEF